jgi:thymidylate synthase
MNQVDFEYSEIIRLLLSAEKRGDRTGTGTRSVFHYASSYDLQYQFPILSLKKLHWKSIVHELLWFVSGNSNVRYLQQNGVRIWDEWADENGDLGPVYGRQWRSWQGADGKQHDQLRDVLQRIKSEPESRRLIISAWNVSDIETMALPPCHCLFQFYVRSGKYLDCQLYQRSGDAFLGVPFNIASYALLTCMIAQVSGLKPGRLYHVFGDLHLYQNHEAQAREILSRAEQPNYESNPTLRLNPNIDSLFDFTADDIQLDGYAPMPAIKADVSI